MDIVPPTTDELTTQQGQPRPLLIVLAVIIALVSGWHALLLPGGLIQRNTAPVDMAGKIYGLRDMWVESNGTVTLIRDGYVDRMCTYRIPPSGVLWRDKEPLLHFAELDLSGIDHGRSKLLAGGGLLDVLAAEGYWELIREMRPDDGSGDGGLPTFFDEASNDPGVEGAAEPVEAASSKPGVVIRILNEAGEHLTTLLEGHSYYPSIDSFASLDPHLWFTTGGQRCLHYVHASDANSEIEIHAVKSIVLDTADRVGRKCIVGYDPSRYELFLARANGTRTWFDAATLEIIEEDTLPGVWDVEYATLGMNTYEYVHEQGVPLSRGSYELLLRILMVLFLLSLLTLAYEGRRLWKYTSATTTEATGSSSKSSNT